jgi:hypothetical protein
MVKNLRPAPNWIGDDDRFWIRNETAGAVDFVVVDAATGERRDAFDHAAMASALTLAGLEDVRPEALPIYGLDLSGVDIKVTTASGNFVCAADASLCEKDETRPPSAAERPSPDRSRIAFVRDHNLWLRDVDTGRETALTKDGEEGFVYGHLLLLDVGRVERRRQGNPEPLMGVNWSPDGRYITTMRVDVRDLS